MISRIEIKNFRGIRSMTTELGPLTAFEAVEKLGSPTGAEFTQKNSDEETSEV